MKFKFLRETRKAKAGDVIELDKGSFWAEYWLEKKIIQPFCREKAPKKKKEIKNESV